ncbi:Aspartic proteinase CDR1 [Linum perenne]
MHRDSVNSPFYDRLETPSQRTGNTVRRAVSRAGSQADFAPTSLASAVAAPLIANDGEYLMNISLGSPPFPVLAIADTGSDIIWTQCQPCIDCYKQNAPIFDPKSSSTYNPVPCYSDTCLLLVGEGSFCSSDAQSCEYKVAYGDQSHTLGDITTETLTLEASNVNVHVAFPNTIFGCGHDNKGTFSPKGSGIIGLGGGPASLITQLGPTIQGKFSYCMVQYFLFTKTTSTMHFGQNAVVSGNDVVSTNLFSSDLTPTFYMIELRSVTVGNTTIPFAGVPLQSSGNIIVDSGGRSSTAATSSEGNIIIDSGTTLTLIPSGVQSQVADALSSQVSGGTATSVQDLAPCYKVDGAGLKVPTVTVHFDGGDVELKDGNVFIEVADDVFCSAFLASDSLSIYGNVAQQNFLVGYDSQGGSLTFKATDCSGGAADVDN